MAIKLTQHVKERYAQRIMSRDDRSDVAVFVAQNEDKIAKDIEKMVDYGEELYHGKPINGDKGNPEHVTVILNGCWVVIMEPKHRKIITLFKIDLGLGKEFNVNYISKLKDKLLKAKKEYSAAEARIDTEISDYKKTISENQAVINEYKRAINILESSNKHLNDEIALADERKKIASREVRTVVGSFVGKQVF